MEDKDRLKRTLADEARKNALERPSLEEQVKQQGEKHKQVLGFKVSEWFQRFIKGR